MFKKYINENEMIVNLQQLIQIPSVHSNSTNPNEPFGENTVKALKCILDLARNLGFRTKNVDGYCGYIEFGEGEKLIGIIGHLDVVPEGENWTYPPFSAEIHDGRIYGRGAIDDKGPVIASLYAMKAVMDYCNENSIKINKRVRLILGLNEERNWKCIQYYKEHEEIPSIGFSPDADFPCIYAEKGVISIILSLDYSKYKNQSIQIKNINCNNNPLNVVPEYCDCILKVQNISINELNEKIIKYSKENNFDIDIENINSNEIKIISKGIRAHAAHPDLGVNAISRLIIILDKIFKDYNIENPLFDLYTKYIGLDYNGNNLNINIPDESGSLTLNLGQFYIDEISNKLNIGCNLRVPINTTFEFVENVFSIITKEFKDIEFVSKGKNNPLYISKDSYLVKTLCKIYNDYTNSNIDPIAIGGATYARAFPNFISFGANLPGQKDMCHQTNEFISIDNLKTACNIYCIAIYELLK